MLERVVRTLVMWGMVGSLNSCTPITYAPRPYQFGQLQSSPAKEEAVKNLNWLLKQLCKEAHADSERVVCTYELPVSSTNPRQVSFDRYTIRTELDYKEIRQLQVTDDRMGTHCIVFNGNPLSYVDNSRLDNPICSQSEGAINEAASALETLRR